jgi:mannose-6-phosphate isomerase
MGGAVDAKFPHSKLYDPPIDEFSILLTDVAGTASVPGVNGPSILLVTAGACEAVCGGVTHQLPLGSVWFIAANTHVEYKGTATFYQAFCAL